LTSLLDINEMPIIMNESEDNVSEQNCNCQKNSGITTSCGKYP